MSTFKDIHSSYTRLKGHHNSQLGSESFETELMLLARFCHGYLQDKNRVPLISKVVGKEYFSFIKDLKTSRPVRVDLFSEDSREIDTFFKALKLDQFHSVYRATIERAVYTIAISFCAIIDLEKNGDQKTPGTFFEYFIGHCYSKKLKVTPRTRIEALNLDKKTTLPTDFIFDLGIEKPKFHLPIKTSTRERVIQVWAHQRVLDGVYGVGRFWGTLVCLSETKKDNKKSEVVEICLPLQWQLYQMFIAQMKRVYYLDLPEPYMKLNEVFPRIQVKSFADFFFEVDDLTNFD